MADEKTSALTALTTPAGGDLLAIVDISDTTMAATGTNKKLTIANLFGKIPSQLVCIGDTANAKMTVGLTINQGGNDDEALALKSSDVATGITTITETDTFGYMKKINADEGGLSIVGLNEVSVGLWLGGAGVTDITAKSTAAHGYIDLVGYKKTGTTLGDAGADANLVVIKNNATTRFIFDVEGSAHGDVEWVAFDDQDDIALLTALETEFDTRKAVTRGFGRMIGENKELLQRAGIVNFYDDGPRAMVNWTRLNMLMVGALRQLGAKVARYEQVLLNLGVSPKLLEA